MKRRMEVLDKSHSCSASVHPNREDGWDTERRELVLDVQACHPLYADCWRLASGI